MIIINGKETNASEVDSGLFFGKGIFETIYIGSRPVLLEEHLKRLNNSAKIMGLDRELSREEVLSIIERYNLNNIAFKITLTEKNLIYSTREIPYKKEDYLKGFNLGISPVLKNSTSKLAYIKSTCYIENLMVREAGQKEGYDEMIWINEKGHITEGCLSNIFFIKYGEIHTPKTSSGLLEGVIRNWVIKNYKVKVGTYTIKDIECCDGIFLTNSLIGIMEVTSLNDMEIIRCNIISEIQRKYFNMLEDGDNG